MRAWTRTLSAAAPPIPVIVEIHLDQMWDAQDVVFAAIQRRNFPAEIEEIRRKNINNPNSRKELLIKSSALLKLNPFMDAQGVVRVGSRLAKAKMPDEKKYPAILPRKDENVRAWIRYNHTRELHAGPLHTLNMTREHSWIIHGQQDSWGLMKRLISITRARICY